MSFNRMVESTASELQTIGVKKPAPNGTTNNQNKSSSTANKPPIKYEPMPRHHRIRTHVFSSTGTPNAREKNSNENLNDLTNASHKDHQTTWHGGILDRKTQQLLSRNRRKSFSEK